MVLEMDRFSRNVPLCYYEISLQLYCMSTVHEDLYLCRFKCVFAYKVAPYFILNNANKPTVIVLIFQNLYCAIIVVVIL